MLAKLGFHCRSEEIGRWSENETNICPAASNQLKPIIFIFLFDKNSVFVLVCRRVDPPLNGHVDLTSSAFLRALILFVEAKTPF